MKKMINNINKESLFYDSHAVLYVPILLPNAKSVNSFAQCTLFYTFSFFFLAHCQKTTGGTVHKSCVSPSEKTYYCLK